MKKSLKIIKYILLLVIIIIFIRYCFKIVVPNNYSLKIELDYMNSPTIIDTFYFYDKAIILEYYPNSQFGTQKLIKYYFNENINVTELKSMLNNKFEKIYSNSETENIDEILVLPSNYKFIENNSGGLEYYIKGTYVYEINNEIEKILEKNLIKRIGFEIVK